MSSVSETADVVICGGAAIGSSVAYHLAAEPGFSGKVLVIEKDPTYRYSASALSAASIRQQFSSAVNIRISLFGIDFLRDIGRHLRSMARCRRSIFTRAVIFISPGRKGRRFSKPTRGFSSRRERISRSMLRICCAANSRG